MMGSKNRFAALKIDDDEDDRPAATNAKPNQNQNAAAKKKKNKKKKEEGDLRNMAFGLVRPSSGKQQKQSGGRGNKQAKPEDWDDWARRDTEATEEMFEKDLQAALLDSKLDAEQQKERRKQMEAEMRAAGIPITANGTKDGGKKKKKKDKPQAMSLDQFKSLPAERAPGSDDDDEPEPSPPPMQTRVPSESQNTTYFESVASDATRILQKERIQEQYQKAYSAENALKSKYKDELEKKDKEIAMLRTSLENQAAELKQVKKRSSTLCKLLQHGEMKDKASILVQVEELTTVKDELTEQVGELTADLEKERSKVHALKSENDKLKGKHSK